MKIKVTSVFVKDQEKALQFYTDILRFEKKTEIPVGEHKWLTVVSPEDEHSIELLLEPNQHPAAMEYQKAIYQDGIPATAFEVDDIESEYTRLCKLQVSFKQAPTNVGDVMIAVFDDTCGNLIQIYEKK